MCNLPLISVVVPNFNQAGFLTEALDSIFSQKDAFAEVIVIDGGSTDGSVDVIRRFQDRLAFWCSEPDQGHYDAVNKGMAQAHGEILGFLNSDDKLFPGSLRILREVFATHSEVEWVTSLVPISCDASGICCTVNHIPGYSAQAFLDGQFGGQPGAPWFIQQESTFWRRRLWDKVGGRIRSEISHAGDFDLWGRFFEQSQLYGIGVPLAGFRIRNGQRSAEGSSYPDQCRELLKEFRRRASWSRSRLRDTTIRLGLFRVPKLGGALRRTIGFRGKRIFLQNPGREDARWETQDYLFP